MDGLTFILLLSALACIFLYFRREKSNKNLPPSLGGSLDNFKRLFFSKQTPRSVYGRAIDECGEIYSFSMGLNFIVLNSFHAVQEAFVNQGDIFSGRQKDMISAAMDQGGVAGTDGPLWQEHRRFMLRVLRDFGMGKSIVSDLVQDEIKAMVSLISNANGSPLITPDIFTATINNVIARLAFGERSATEDPHFKEFTEHMDSMLANSALNIVAFTFPFLLKIPFLKAKFPLFYHNDAINDYIKRKIQQRALAMKAMDPPPTEVDQATSVCEAFLIEQANQERSNPGGHTFTDHQIAQCMADIFIAGTDTTAATLNWSMLLMATHPEAQRRVQQEIEDVIGRQRLPMMSDRPQLPYVSAVMDEVMRYASVIPLNLVHRCLKDTKLLGYDIPANALIQTNIYSIHRNPKNWARPFDFYPPHFLSEEGNYSPSKLLIPFSIGKRACLGESLARMEYFIAFVALMQKFSVCLSNQDADTEAILDGSLRFVRHPLPHKIVFEPLDT